jgi:hypothetical protein
MFVLIYNNFTYITLEMFVKSVAGRPVCSLGLKRQAPTYIIYLIPEMAVQFAARVRNCISCSQLEDGHFAVLFFYLSLVGFRLWLLEYLLYMGLLDNWMFNEWVIIGKRNRKDSEKSQTWCQSVHSKSYVDCL